MSRFIKPLFQHILFSFVSMLFISLSIYGNEAVQSFDWICIPGKKVGPISANTSESELIKLFGSKNVTREEIHIDEGIFEMGTTIFKGTPNEISIFWKEQNASDLKYPERVVIKSDGSNWKTDSGIQIGTPIADLVKINMAPITFAGFDWDYEGVVLDWNKGKLENLLISVRLNRKNFTDIPGTSGDGAKLSSEDKRLIPLELYVSQFDIIFEKNE
jgi:hypothetical protein